MYQDGVKRCILPGKILLQGCCVWPDNDSLIYKSAGWFVFWNLFVMESCHAAYVCKYLTDISEAVGAGATVTTTMEVLLNLIIFKELLWLFFKGVVRLYIMLQKRTILHTILVKIWKNFWSVNVINPYQREKMENRAKIALILTTSFLASATISNSQISGVPFIKNRGMILRSIFPFDGYKIYNYELTYVWQFSCDWFILFMINAFDYFFIALVTICSVQFVIVQEVIRSILTEESRGHREMIFGERGKTMDDREMLKECLEQHKLIIG